MHRFGLFKWMMFFIVFFASTAWAFEPRYMFLHYAIQSISPDFSDKDCQELLKAPYEYTLLSDQDLNFITVNPVKLSHFKLVNQTLIKKHLYLLNLNFDAEFEFKAEPKQTVETMEYVLDTRNHNIKGNFILHQFCKGQILGMEIK
jgi:hypothetical protein